MSPTSVRPTSVVPPSFSIVASVAFFVVDVDGDHGPEAGPIRPVDHAALMYRGSAGPVPPEGRS